MGSWVADGFMGQHGAMGGCPVRQPTTGRNGKGGQAIGSICKLKSAPNEADSPTHNLMVEPVKNDSSLQTMSNESLRDKIPLQSQKSL